MIVFHKISHVKKRSFFVGRKVTSYLPLRVSQLPPRPEFRKDVSQTNRAERAARVPFPLQFLLGWAEFRTSEDEVGEKNPPSPTNLRGRELVADWLFGTFQKIPPPLPPTHPHRAACAPLIWRPRRAPPRPPSARRSPRSPAGPAFRPRSVSRPPSPLRLAAARRQAGTRARARAFGAPRP